MEINKNCFPCINADGSIPSQLSMDHAQWIFSPDDETDFFMNQQDLPKRSFGIGLSKQPSLLSMSPSMSLPKDAFQPVQIPTTSENKPKSALTTMLAAETSQLPIPETPFSTVPPSALKGILPLESPLKMKRTLSRVTFDDIEELTAAAQADSQSISQAPTRSSMIKVRNTTGGSTTVLPAPCSSSSSIDSMTAGHFREVPSRPSSPHANKSSPRNKVCTNLVDTSPNTPMAPPEYPGGTLASRPSCDSFMGVLSNAISSMFPSAGRSLPTASAPEADVARLLRTRSLNSAPASLPHSEKHEVRTTHTSYVESDCPEDGIRKCDRQQ